MTNGYSWHSSMLLSKSWQPYFVFWEKSLVHTLFWGNPIWMCCSPLSNKILIVHDPIALFKLTWFPSQKPRRIFQTQSGKFKGHFPTVGGEGSDLYCLHPAPPHHFRYALGTKRHWFALTLESANLNSQTFFSPIKWIPRWILNMHSEEFAKVIALQCFMTMCRRDFK